MNGGMGSLRTLLGCLHRIRGRYRSIDAPVRIGLLQFGLLVLPLLRLPLLPLSLLQLLQHSFQLDAITIQHDPDLFPVPTRQSTKGKPASSSQPLPVLLRNARLGVLVRAVLDEHDSQRAAVFLVDLRLEGDDGPVNTEMTTDQLIRC